MYRQTLTTSATVVRLSCKTGLEMMQPSVIVERSTSPVVVSVRPLNKLKLSCF